MLEFEEYINSIIRNLRVSKRKKAEMSDEYRDHLSMLKKEYIKNGLTEEAAVKEAIKSFGNSENLNVLLNNIFGYRTITNMLSGIFFTILIFIIGGYIPMPALLTTTENPLSVIDTFLMIIPSTAIFIPVGYFLPIIVKRAGKMKIHIFASILLSMIMGIIISISLGSVQTTLITNLRLLQLALIVTSTLGGLLGSAIGFLVLKMISKISLKLRYSMS